MCIVRKSVAGAALAVVASGVAAQSSVTLYGVADAFFQWYDNGGQHSWSMRSGGNSGSMVGLKGSEDLGSGLKAVFTLESGFNINNGTAFADSSVMFYRQAWVGLSHEKYGSLTFGRQYQPTFWSLYPTDPFRANEVLSPLAASANSIDRNTIATQTGGGRSSNAIVYKSPNLSGFQLWGMYALAASVTQPYPQSTGNMLDVAATYSGYGLYAGVSYQFQHPGSKTLPGLPAAVNTVSVEHYTAALAYRIGIVNLQANYTYHKPENPAAGSVAARLNAAHPFSVAEIGATIQATPADAIEIAGFQRLARGVHDNTWGVQVGADHSLSKRTTLYARAGFMKNNGLATTAWPGYTTTAGENQTLVGVGMSHRF
ncbi:MULTISPECIES: porin [Caballeronia]|jgi:predicted porin|uniref:porin n=1 Tax=Caballeronia TaxID=1827195 RepID=UPI00025BACD4|nr:MULTISPECIES: porin [Caballeronia]EKS69501.1 porin [Burkholderia sp. SJ98]